MSVALGISKLEQGTPGDGVPGASLSEVADGIAEGTVGFSFSEPTESNINSEQSDTPVHTIISKEDPEYIEFSLISPTAATMVIFAGGTATGDKWEMPTAIPEINRTIKLTTKTVGGSYYEYTVVNGKVVAKLDQAPGKKQEERLLVRVYLQEAKTSGGTVNTPFIREKVSA